MEVFYHLGEGWNTDFCGLGGFKQILKTKMV
jgi:hypothetical protein